MSYHYDPILALDELNEENLLPNPVFVRDMIFRAKLTPEQAREVDSAFEPYLAIFAPAYIRGFLVDRTKCLKTTICGPVTHHVLSAGTVTEARDCYDRADASSGRWMHVRSDSVRSDRYSGRVWILSLPELSTPYGRACGCLRSVHRWPGRVVVGRPSAIRIFAWCTSGILP